MRFAGVSGNRFTLAELLACWVTFSATYLNTNTFPREYLFCVTNFVPHRLDSDRSAPSDAPRNLKASAVYSPLHMALRHRWSTLTRKQTKELNPAVFHAILGVLN